MQFQSSQPFSSPPNTRGRPSLGSSLRLHGKAFSSEVTCRRVTIQCCCKRGELFFKLSPDTSVSSVTVDRRAKRPSAILFDVHVHLCACVRTTNACFGMRQEAMTCASRDVNSRHETTVKQSAAGLLVVSQREVEKEVRHSQSTHTSATSAEGWTHHQCSRCPWRSSCHLSTPRSRTHPCGYKNRTSLCSLCPSSVVNAAGFFSKEPWLEQYFGHMRLSGVAVVVVVGVVGIAVGQVSRGAYSVDTPPRLVGIWLSASASRGHQLLHTAPPFSNVARDDTSSRQPVAVMFISTLRCFASRICRACPHSFVLRRSGTLRLPSILSVRHMEFEQLLLGT